MSKKIKDQGVFGKTYDYVATVAKTYKAWDKLGPNSPAHTPESGQFWGAVLQNRKYDAKGKLITGKPKPQTGTIKKFKKTATKKSK